MATKHQLIAKCYNPKVKTLKNKTILCLNFEKLFKVIKQR